MTFLARVRRHSVTDSPLCTVAHGNRVPLQLAILGFGTWGRVLSVWPAGLRRFLSEFRRGPADHSLQT